MKRFLIGIILILLWACGSKELAGGSVELPGEISKDTLVSTDGQGLSQVQLVFVPMQNQWDSSKWVLTQTDPQGAIQVKLIQNQNYQLILRDSAKNLGALLSYNPSTQTRLPKINMQEMQQVQMILGTRFKTGARIGFEGTDMWAPIGSSNRTIKLNQVPQGRYRLLYKYDSMQISEVIDSNYIVDSLIGSKSDTLN